MTKIVVHIDRLVLPKGSGRDVARQIERAVMQELSAPGAARALETAPAQQGRVQTQPGRGDLGVGPAIGRAISGQMGRGGKS